MVPSQAEQPDNIPAMASRPTVRPSIFESILRPFIARPYSYGLSGCFKIGQTVILHKMRGAAPQRP